MQRICLRTALFAAALWPMAALALAPANVTGLSAHREGGQITVRWEAPAERADEIAAYRVYFGQKSILKSGGDYDDFVTTSGKNTEFLFTSIPPQPQMFFGVLAVNGDGVESGSFVEEVQVDLLVPAGEGLASSSAVAPSPSRREKERSTLGLLRAEASSPTTIHLALSTFVHVPVERAVQAFTVIDGRGNPLQLRRLIIEGDRVTLVSLPQVPGRDYAVRVNSVVTGRPGAGAELPVDPERNMATFAGFNDTSAPSSPVGANVISPPKSGNLFTSGAPVLGIIVISGAAAGWRRMKRKANNALCAALD
jgi:hypothetical protein